MRLTPADVHNVAFKKPSYGKRGYDEDEVDAFLDLVEAELAHLIEENNELTQKLAAQSTASSDQGDQDAPTGQAAPDLHKAEPTSQRDENTEPAQPDPAVTPVVTSAVAAPQAAPVAAAAGGGADGMADHHLAAARLLGLAQDTADRLTTEAAAEAEQVRSSARSDSEKMLTDAKNESDKLRSEARIESEKVRGDAKTESERMLTDAKNTSDRMVGEATVKAEALQRDSRMKAEASDREAQDKYNQVIGDLGTQRSNLEAKIDDLRTYEREYRGRLREWITAHLTQLDDDGAATATNNARDGAHATESAR